MLMILAIAGGGAIGSVLRHLSGRAAMMLFGISFPYGTLFVNVAGSFVMGAVVAFFARHGNPSQEWRGFLTVGVLGGFTTFSAFTLDTVALYERGEMVTAILYVTLSLILSLAALACGLFLVRSLPV